jgi:hypothetical protein
MLTTGLLVGVSLAVPARADVVTEWNEIALAATTAARLPPPPQARAMALVHAAIYDAVNGVERRHQPYVVKLSPANGTSPEAAAAAAAHQILASLFPQTRVQLDASLAKSLEPIADGAPKADGVAFGREVAEKLFAIRLLDGFNGIKSYQGRTGVGAWQPTVPDRAPPVLPHWGAVTPFTLTSSTQLALPPPPAEDSATGIRDLEEVSKMGGWDSTARTSEQTAIAIYWSGSEVPPWNTVARAAAKAHGNSVEANARLFALLNMTMADSLIAGFAYKYEYFHWRPVTAIQAAASEGAPVTSDARGWRPLLVTPPHPEYPSAHCLASGAAATVLRTFFGSDIVDVSTIYPALGVLRTWHTYSQIVEEVEDARVWGGIHFRSADEQGTLLGDRIASHALKEILQPLPGLLP